MSKQVKFKKNDFKAVAQTASSWSDIGHQFGMSLQQVQKFCRDHSIKPAFTKTRRKNYERLV